MGGFSTPGALQIPEHMIGAFTSISRFTNVAASQGVASDGTYLYCTSTATIEKRNIADGSLVTSNNAPFVGGTALSNLASIHVRGDYLYIGAANFPATPKKGYIRVYNKSDLSYYGEHQVKDSSGLFRWPAGCAYYDSAWWVVYGGEESLIISKYNDSWVWQADYNLTFPQAGCGQYIIPQGYEGIFWIDDFLFANIHEDILPEKCDVYKWNGSGFDRIIRLTPPTSYCHQGLCKEPNEDVMWWAERNYPAVGTYNILKSSITWLQIVPNLTLLNERDKRSSAHAYAASVHQICPPNGRPTLMFDTLEYDTAGELDITIKTGTATATTASHLIDTVKNQFVVADVGRNIWNTTDNTYAKVTAYNSNSDLTLATDIMANGENYTLYDSRFIAKKACPVMVTVSCRFQTNIEVGKRYSVAIFLNGICVSQSGIGGAATTDAQLLTCSTSLNLKRGDVLENVVWNNATGNVTLSPGIHQVHLRVAELPSEGPRELY